jgi:alkylated DNA repair dioxygenase AlkB
VPTFQPSLLEAHCELGLSALPSPDGRIHLGAGAWVDRQPGWVTGTDQLFERLRRSVPWAAERRRMFDRMVDVPRLVAFYDQGEVLPDPFVTQIGQRLSAHYGAELGEPFCTVGLCLYRDGRDSVAWHGDTSGRGRTEDTMVAIVSLGGPRSFLLRPKGGGVSRRFELGSGDLLVMGGSCQRTWEHSIPKRAKGAGPRISVQFRRRGVR